MFDKAYALAETDLEKERIRLFDEAILQGIERGVKRYDALLQADRRLVLKMGIAGEAKIEDAGTVSVVHNAGEWTVGFSDLSPEWRKVQVVLDPGRRRREVVSASVDRKGREEVTSGVRMSGIRPEKNAVSFRLQLPPEARSEFTPAKVWGGDFYIWSGKNDKPTQWSSTGRQPKDPEGFGIIEFR